MELITLTKTITQPLEAIEAFADKKGYQSKVPNPDYVEAVGSPTIDDTTQTPDEMGIYPQIPNPDYVPAVGERIIDNPVTRTQFVSDLFDDFVSRNFFGVFAIDEEKKAREEEAKVAAEARIQAIKASIKTK